MASCPLCDARKGRRACPAKGALICPQCCGTKRLVLIDCPSDCVFLDGGAAGWARETTMRRDAARLHEMIGELTEARIRLLFMSLVGVVALRARHHGMQGLPPPRPRRPRGKRNGDEDDPGHGEAVAEEGQRFDMGR